ncbi:hypothetical protein CXF72_03500 [Psychromonas sp. MB-3u-54]|uniref:transposase DNA-binding-containing protein n=1 Tax=Psychromonas sp. MB-3u-54 TaxID=2058319 RepID=UPI000C337932|nr:hypothetical protein CXF72_03500 [Psychromonas sp. MB-3u-54]
MLNENPEAWAKFIFSKAKLGDPRRTKRVVQVATGLSYKHSVRKELGAVNSASKQSSSPVGRTLYVHSTLMLDANSEQVLRLAYQNYFYRKKGSRKISSITVSRSVFFKRVVA